MNTSRPFHFHPPGGSACNCWAVRRAKVRRTPAGRRARALQ
ncbi:MAG TPA: hypothetical protein VMS17_08000 [Gemmataceae bacterium]|nr:hypothetical protein [Gemmataceae bacterium]